jgi:hypothetical protein
MTMGLLSQAANTLKAHTISRPAKRGIARREWGILHTTSQT